MEAIQACVCVWFGRVSDRNYIIISMQSHAPICAYLWGQVIKKTMKKELIKLLNSVSFTDDETIANYGGDNSYYRHDLKVFNDNKKACLHNLKQIKRINKDKLIKTCKEVWGGRLSFDGKRFEYTAGQFYTLELPQAIGAVVLSYLIK